MHMADATSMSAPPTTPTGGAAPAGAPRPAEGSSAAAAGAEPAPASPSAAVATGAALASAPVFSSGHAGATHVHSVHASAGTALSSSASTSPGAVTGAQADDTAGTGDANGSDEDEPPAEGNATKPCCGCKTGACGIGSKCGCVAGGKKCVSCKPLAENRCENVLNNPTLEPSALKRVPSTAAAAPSSYSSSSGAGGSATAVPSGGTPSSPAKNKKHRPKHPAAVATPSASSNPMRELAAMLSTDAEIAQFDNTDSVVYSAGTLSKMREYAIEGEKRVAAKNLELMQAEKARREEMIRVQELALQLAHEKAKSAELRKRATAAHQQAGDAAMAAPSSSSASARRSGTAFTGFAQLPGNPAKRTRFNLTTPAAEQEDGEIEEEETLSSQQEPHAHQAPSAAAPSDSHASNSTTGAWLVGIGLGIQSFDRDALAAVCQLLVQDGKGILGSDINDGLLLSLLPTNIEKLARLSGYSGPMRWKIMFATEHARAPSASVGNSATLPSSP